MLRDMIELLKTIPYEECEQSMKIAKGKHQLPTNWKAIKRHLKDKANG
jgi:hypothetical protein